DLSQGNKGLLAVDQAELLAHQQDIAHGVAFLKTFRGTLSSDANNLTAIAVVDYRLAGFASAEGDLGSAVSFAREGLVSLKRAGESWPVIEVGLQLVMAQYSIVVGKFAEAGEILHQAEEMTIQIAGGSNPTLGRLSQLTGLNWEH